ncbi:MAG: metalloregulator ArsR/SmtB family transcription factor [Desulfohalobiaceae bacterium]
MSDVETFIVLKALAHETRWRMIELLLGHSLCVGALAQALGVTEAAASQHLQILRKAGLVRGEKRGYWTHYLVQTEELKSLGKELSELPERVANLKDLNTELGSGPDPKNIQTGGE